MSAPLLPDHDQLQPAPPRSRFWTRGPGVMLLIVFVGLLAFGAYALAAANRDPMNGYTAQVLSCEFASTGGQTIATVKYAVTNHHDDARVAVVRINYVDEQGKVIDHDASQSPTIAAGATGRGVEMTSLDVPAKTGRCLIVAVD
jgi:hypothetical protein